MSRFIFNDSPTASVALLINYAAGYHPDKATKERDVYFKSKNMFLIMDENSALMAHSGAVQSSIRGVSGCSKTFRPASRRPHAERKSNTKSPHLYPACPETMHQTQSRVAQL